MEGELSICFWCGHLQQPNKYYNDYLTTFIMAVLSDDSDFDVSVANDVAKRALPGKVMQ